jgi:hypothetical protein
MSYVDMMGDHRWNEDEHTNRTEAMVRNTVSVSRERILTRRMLGAMLPPDHPLYRPMTLAQQAELAAAVATFDAAEAAGDAARTDMAVLSRVLDHEQGVALLAEDDAEGQALLAQRAAARPAAEEAPPEPPVDPVEEPLP